MARRQTDNKPLSEPRIAKNTDAYKRYAASVN